MTDNNPHNYYDYNNTFSITQHNLEQHLMLQRYTYEVNTFAPLRLIQELIAAHSNPQKLNNKNKNENDDNHNEEKDKEQVNKKQDFYDVMDLEERLEAKIYQNDYGDDDSDSDSDDDNDDNDNNKKEKDIKKKTQPSSSSSQPPRYKPAPQLQIITITSAASMSYSTQLSAYCGSKSATTQALRSFRFDHQRLLILQQQQYQCFQQQKLRTPAMMHGNISPFVDDIILKHTTGVQVQDGFKYEEKPKPTKATTPTSLLTTPRVVPPRSTHNFLISLYFVILHHLIPGATNSGFYRSGPCPSVFVYDDDDDDDDDDEQQNIKEKNTKSTTTKNKKNDNDDDNNSKGDGGTFSTPAIHVPNVHWFTVMPWHIDNTSMFRNVRNNWLIRYLVPSLQPSDVTNEVVSFIDDKLEMTWMNTLEHTQAKVDATYKHKKNKKDNNDNDIVYPYPIGVTTFTERVIPSILNITPVLSLLPLWLSDFLVGFAGGWDAIDTMVMKKRY